MQYVSITLEKIKNSVDKPISAGAICSICFIFDAEKKGTLLLDQVGFAMGPDISP